VDQVGGDTPRPLTHYTTLAAGLGRRDLRLRLRWLFRELRSVRDLRRVRLRFVGRGGLGHAGARSWIGRRGWCGGRVRGCRGARQRLFRSRGLRNLERVEVGHSQRLPAITTGETRACSERRHPQSRPSTTLGIRSGKLAIVLSVLVASCGGSEEDPPASRAREAEILDVRVTVAPQGPGGPEQTRRIKCAELGADAADRRCRDLGGLRRQDLDPVPRRTACTQIYGGPAAARVSGQLRGSPVAGSFDLTDGCELDRWRRNAALLGPPPGR
jgi:hypothetical protein